jgi:hypothetical protein
VDGCAFQEVTWIRHIDHVEGRAIGGYLDGEGPAAAGAASQASRAAAVGIERSDGKGLGAGYVSALAVRLQGGRTRSGPVQRDIGQPGGLAAAGESDVRCLPVAIQVRLRDDADGGLAWLHEQGDRRQHDDGQQGHPEALYTGDTRRLKEWLEMSPRNAVTVLDTHDGIGVIDVGPDRRGPDSTPGLLTPEEIDRLVETIHERSNGESRQATGAAASNLDLYQVNCTFYDALGRRDDDYLIARAVQFFAPGVPQVYYVGLLAGTNDMDLLRRTGVGRDINRHYYTHAELQERLEAPVLRSLLDLIRFRNTHPAFAGNFQILNSANSSLVMEWRKHSDWARIDIDLAARHAVISHSDRSGRYKKMFVAPATVEVDR